MLDTGVGIATMVLVCAAFLFLGVSYVGRARQSVEEYTVSRNHAPVNVGIATLIASLFGTWVLLSPGETSANFGIVSLAGYGSGNGGDYGVVHVRRATDTPAYAQRTLGDRVRQAPLWNGALHRHLAGDYLHHRHIHHRRDDGHHHGGAHTDGHAAMGHGYGRRHRGGGVYRIRRAAGVHLHRPHPVLGADTGDAAAGHRSGGDGGRQRRMEVGRRRRAAVGKLRRQLLLRHRPDYRHRGVQRLSSRTVAAGLHRGEPEDAESKSLGARRPWPYR